jgi:heme exporter protein A
MHRESPVADDERRHLVGLVSPYLQLYEEFSALENLSLSLRLRGDRPDTGFHRTLLTRVTLDPDRDDPVRGYSSGMKQRLKLALALAHRPEVLVLDEPMANLDVDGVDIVRAIMKEHRTHGILVVATNDLTDLVDPDVRVDLNVRR